MNLSIRLFSLLLLMLLLSACSEAPDDTAQQISGAQETVSQEYRIPVTAIMVEQGLIEDLTYVQGVIEAINAPEIKSKVSAEVVEVNVDEGDTVEAGDVLARLDDEGFRLDKEAAEADIQRFQVLLENQQSILKRDQSLKRQKVIADTKLDESRTAVLQTRAQLSQAQALLKKTEYLLSHTQIIAPITGVVQQRSVSKGDYVNPMSPNNKTLFQIVDTHHLRARLFFPETLAQLITIGMDVSLYNHENRVVAHIQHLRPMLETHNKALHALADFTNTKHWKPGEAITARVILRQNDQSMLVPEAVLIRRPTGLMVYRLVDGKAQEVPVTTGIKQGNKVEIISGIAVGDQLALDGAAYLSDGVAIEIQDITPNDNVREQGKAP